MAETENRNTNRTSDETHPKKRKGFWSNVLGRSSNANDVDENKDGQQPKRQGFMDTVKTNARQVATTVVTHVAEKELENEIEAKLNNNSSQPTNTNSTNSGTTTTSDALSSTTNWAKRMMDNAQQKVQNLQQNLGA